MTQVSQAQIAQIAENVRFTEKTDTSMRCLLEDKYLGTITRSVEVLDGESVVTWGIQHPAHSDWKTSKPTRREAVLELIVKHVNK